MATTIQEAAEAADAAGQRELDALSAAMTTDAPAAVRSAHLSVVESLNQLRNAAGAGLADVAALEREAGDYQDKSLPELARAATLRATEARSNLAAAVQRQADQAQAILSVVEAEAQLALLIREGSDSGTTSLSRQEVEALAGAEVGWALVNKLAANVGQSVEVDSALCSDWCGRKIANSVPPGRERAELLKTWNILLVEKLRQVDPPRSRGTAAAARILNLLPRAKAGVGAIHQAARIRGGL